MPKFELNKLVRDKLPNEYERMGQKADYRELSADDNKRELIRKIIEETVEIKINDPVDKIIGEIADIRQATDDLMMAFDISEDQVKIVQQAKYDKKGGFKSGAFVKTLELADDDEWVKYYRERPDVFPEIK